MHQSGMSTLHGLAGGRLLVLSRPGSDVALGAHTQPRASRFPGRRRQERPTTNEPRDNQTDATTALLSRAVPVSLLGPITLPPHLTLFNWGHRFATSGETERHNRGLVRRAPAPPQDSRRHPDPDSRTIDIAAPLPFLQDVGGTGAFPRLREPGGL